MFSFFTAFTTDCLFLDSLIPILITFCLCCTTKNCKILKICYFLQKKTPIMLVSIMIKLGWCGVLRFAFSLILNMISIFHVFFFFSFFLFIYLFLPFNFVFIISIYLFIYFLQYILCVYYHFVVDVVLNLSFYFGLICFKSEINIKNK